MGGSPRTHNGPYHGCVFHAFNQLLDHPGLRLKARALSVHLVADRAHRVWRGSHGPFMAMTSHIMATAWGQLLPTSVLGPEWYGAVLSWRTLFINYAWALAQL